MPLPKKTSDILQKDQGTCAAGFLPPASLTGPAAIVAAAISYWLMGWLGLALAIPPGYATPVFPAAGLALAITLHFGVRALPAIWLGSLLLNISVAVTNHAFSVTTLAVAAGIATGALLQAWLGKLLIHRWRPSGLPDLDQEKEVFQFLFLGGILACVIAATFGVGSLVLAGIVPAAAFGYSWWNWYVGDALGVLIAAPFMLTVLRQHQPDWLSRLKTIAPPVLGMLGITVLMFIGAARWESTSQQNKIDDEGRILAQALEQRIIAHREMLAALARLIETTPDLNFSQFDHFTKATLRDAPDLFALSFNPYVTEQERAAFRHKMARTYPTEKNIEITERDRQGHLVSAAHRPEYVPVGLISPLEANRKALGFDINSEARRRDAISRARLSGSTAATTPIKLVQEKKEHTGLLVMAPAFKRDTAPPALAGFAVAVIQVEQLINQAIANKLPPGLEIEIHDPAAEEHSQRLYRSPGFSASTSSRMVWQTRLTMADREWILRVIPSEAYLQAHRPWLAWAAGVIGLFFVALLQILMLGITGRAALIQRQVDAQTIEIRQAMAAAESANQAKSQFLATMSHEIRTPMNGILGMAQMLLMDHIEESERQDYARTILNSGQTLLTLLNDILDFSKIEAGKLELDYSLTDPEQILHETRNLFHENATEKGLAIEAHWNGEAQHYLADAHRIRQMLSNLTNNAIKFTSHGNIQLRGEQVARTGNRALIEFSVSDTGIGIEEEKRELLFQPFSQTDSSITRQFGGTGLGLSIVRNLAQKMGGEVGVDSTPGQGSRFWFRIWAELSDTSCAHSLAPEEGNANDTTLQALQGRILVVEDNLTNQRVIQALLNKLGLDCQIAANGQAGVEALQDNPSLTLVLMDIHMPVMDGHQATKQIRAWETASPSPIRRHIVALTANAFDEDRQQCADAGMDDFLTKPVSLEQLQQVLQRSLTERPD